MTAKPGNGAVIPHWAHRPGSPHVFEGHGEKGEWHQEVQSLFALRGARTEVGMPSLDGQRTHIADVVLADGRIVEAQTHFLNVDQVVSREQTYGEMAWIYNAHDTHAWFVLDDTRSDFRFRWGNADRRFLSHTKPVYFDTGDAVWRLDVITTRHIKEGKGRVLWEGTRTKVAGGLLEFVEMVSDGAVFGAPPRMPTVDPHKTTRGVKLNILQELDEWLADNPTCGYIGTAEELHYRPPLDTPSPPASCTSPDDIAAFNRGVEAANRAMLDRPRRRISDAPAYYTAKQKLDWVAAG